MRNPFKPRWHGGRARMAKVDRGGREYIRIYDTSGYWLRNESETRQARKVRGLSGRQEKKWRKAQWRNRS